MKQNVGSTLIESGTAAINGRRRLLPAKLAADRLGLSIWGLRAMAYQGRIASHKIGVRLMFSEDEIERTIAESERPRLAR